MNPSPTLIPNSSSSSNHNCDTKTIAKPIITPTSIYPPRSTFPLQILEPLHREQGLADEHGYLPQIQLQPKCQPISHYPPPPYRYLNLSIGRKAWPIGTQMPLTHLSHCYYTVGTLLLHCCYTAVTMLLHCCYTEALHRSKGMADRHCVCMCVCVCLCV
jgi:hypothetical protein